MTAVVLGVFLVFILLFHTCCMETLVNKFTFFPEKGMQAYFSEFDATVERVFVETEDGVRVIGFFLRREGVERTVLFFHGNAGNASHRLRHADEIWKRNANVLLMDYRGYGLSEGKPTEAGVYLDGEAGLRFLLEEKKIPLNKIVVLGRSLGTAVAVHISKNRELAGTILVSPLSSGRDVADQSGLGWLGSSIGTPFDSVSKMGSLRAPLLIIHGQKDEMLPIEMGQKLFDAAKVEKEFFKIENAAHNDLIDVGPEL